MVSRPNERRRNERHWEEFMKRCIAAAMLATGLAGGFAGTAFAVELNPKAIAIRQADELKWRDPTGAAPTNQVVLFGDPTKPGFYMVMNRFKPGTFSKPHFHPNDRFITVIKGTWYVGTGNKWDKDATIGVKTGGAVTHFGKEVHYDGAKDEEVIVLITGEGPGINTPVEEAK
jgi:quercetin dioxygenase-like cupin family protein